MHKVILLLSAIAMLNTSCTKMRKYTYKCVHSQYSYPATSLIRENLSVNYLVHSVLSDTLLFGNVHYNGGRGDSTLYLWNNCL